ncbi:MAG: hypothetical protein LQ346_008408 [Caloplaca aetnensis]|nr:MAG: hypothetical protein LQ346_008408 [Caloplaca aetnensis]
MEVFPFLTVLFAARYRELFADILGNSKSFQTSKLASYILSLGHGKLSMYEGVRQDRTSKHMLRELLENEEEACVMSKMDYPLTALEDIVTIYRDIDFWAAAFFRHICREPGMTEPALQRWERKPSPTELYRVRRALWRIWALCESANIRCIAGHCIVNSYAIYDFLEGITLWEFEELECLYLFLRQFYQSLQIHTRKGAREKADFIASQVPAVQRLWATMGIWLETYFATALNPESPWRTLHYFAIIEEDHQFFRGPQAPLTAWPDAPTRANAPNEGWQCYSRNSAISYNEYIRHSGLIWPGCTTPRATPGYAGTRFQKWGYCIWDRKRLDEWDMLEEDGGWDGDCEIPMERWLAGRDGW